MDVRLAVLHCQRSTNIFIIENCPSDFDVLEKKSDEPPWISVSAPPSHQRSIHDLDTSALPAARVTMELYLFNNSTKETDSSPPHLSVAE
jgi:hypothetical protein